ncbi:MAG: 4Fe-4S binding protein, partial [Candidatus Eiseniibacteriota bacterium]
APAGPGAPPPTRQAAAARALHCVNCGECNTVCPIFHSAKIRLPQMLTHIGEATFAGEPIGGTGIKLLDLCMRCGNCEEVCQAGIPHLPLYQVMQGLSERTEGGAPTREARAERHLAILGAVRGSSGYAREFLDIRPGAYQRRTPASLPGVTRFLLLRAENDAGPAATCIHCGACVAVCPTGANQEYEGSDLRTITTDETRCIGCGTCVEVCPANLANGGQTLRVMEAPTREWFLALEEFERAGRA